MAEDGHTPKADFNTLSERRHYACHLQCGLRCFHAAIVLGIQATRCGLLLIFEQQDFVDDRDAVLNLDLHQRLTHGLADVLGVGGFTAKNNSETNDSGGTWCVVRGA